MCETEREREGKERDKDNNQGQKKRDRQTDKQRDRDRERDSEREGKKVTVRERGERQSQRDRDRAIVREKESEGGRARKNKQAHIMLQNVQDVAWNETSHPKSVHVYLLSHQTIPAIQSNKDVHCGSKPHFHSVSVLIVVFHTAHRATGSSSLLKAIQNFSLALIEAGIINTIHNNSHAGARTLPRTNTRAHTHTHTYTCARTRTQTREGKDRL